MTENKRPAVRDRRYSAIFSHLPRPLALIGAKLSSPTAPEPAFADAILWPQGDGF